MKPKTKRPAQSRKDAPAKSDHHYRTVTPRRAGVNALPQFREWLRTFTAAFQWAPDGIEAEQEGAPR